MAKYSYQRVSTVDKQIMDRQEKFARDNDIPIQNWYQEKASGAKEDRIELNKLLDKLEEGDELYIIDASRLTRSMKHLLSLLDLFKEKKIKLVMGDFVLDCRGELSILTQGQILMLGLLNEMQRLMIVSSVNEGLAAAKEKNGGVNPGGRPKLTRERIYATNPDVARYYIDFSQHRINFKEFCRLCVISRNTGYRYLKVLKGESNEPI